MSEDRTRQATGLDRHFVALHSGFRLGKYELQAVLGQGGFGITYQAWDSALNRAVAIKEYLPSDVAVRVDGATVAARSPQDEESFHWGLERFLDEARALARFDAIPAIVRVHDYMQENGTAYMVMALVEGEPLAALYRREAPLSEERLKAIVLPILDGLEEVHRAGFLHRDIKPANILIRPNGSAVLIDFGAARQALGEKSRSITSVFTPGYAPFEQYTSSGKQGPWTDIYALAATLYHGIFGAVPPQATDRIREDGLEPARRIGAGRYSEQFLAAIDRGMEVFENRRPQSIGHWRDMLSGRAAALPDTEVPTLGENGQPYSQPAHSQTGANLTGASQPSMAPPSTSQPSIAPPSVAQPAMASPATMQQAPRRARTGLLLAAALGVVALGGGAAAVLLGGGGSAPTVPIAPPVEETAQQRAERLAQEARVAAEAARTAQFAAEQEAQRRAEEEARQRAIEEQRRREQAALAEAARREEERARQESDTERQRAAAEEARRLEAEEEQAAAARAQAEAELAEARAQAEAARQQAEALRQEAERQRLAAEDERRLQAAAEAKAREEAAEKARAETEARLRAEFEARAQAEAAARTQAEAKAKAEAEAKAGAEAAARAKADAERRLAAQQLAQQQAARQAAPQAAPQQAAPQQAARQPANQSAATTSAAPAAQQQTAIQSAPAAAPPVDPAAYVAQHWATLGPVAERSAASAMFASNFRIEIFEGYEVLEVTPARVVLRLRVSGAPMNAARINETRRVVLAFENAPPAFRSLGQVRAPGS